MLPAPAPAPQPQTVEVEAIARLADPVIRNLRITDCYHRLSLAFSAFTGPCANWCTFATWASRQAGCTIRGEDFLARLDRELSSVSALLHPVQALWRTILRLGLFHPGTPLGRAVRAIHTPFDAFERASDAVARGNRKVFEEIGLVFAHYLEACPEEAAPESQAFQAFLAGLRPGTPPEGQHLLADAFPRYQRLRLETDPKVRAELVLLANLEIGLHEQTRLQPEIREAIDAGPATAEDLGQRALHELIPSAAGWWKLARSPAIALLELLARALHRFSVRITRRTITECLMVLSLPGGRVLLLGNNLADPFPEPLRDIADPDLAALIAQFEPAARAADDCGARDWSELPQRMHYIVHFFRVCQAQPALFAPPFTTEQARLIREGRVPDGSL
jgi:hypothetical protein